MAPSSSRSPGSEIAFNNPSALPWICGVLLFYFLFRYVQYSHEIQDKGIMSRFLQRVEKHLFPVIIRKEFNKPGSLLRNKFKTLKTWRQIKKDRFLWSRVNGGLPLNTVHMALVEQGGGTIHTFTNVKVYKRNLIWPITKSFFYIVIRTRLGTDYILPYILAFFGFSSYWHWIPNLSSLISK